MPLADAKAAHSDDRRAARPLLHHSRWWRHRPEAPGDVAATFNFLLAGEPVDSPAAVEPIADQTKPLLAAVFDRDQELGAALSEVEGKGRFACNASARTRPPSSSTASSSCSAQINANETKWREYLGLERGIMQSI